jgi:hypothetical protein
MLQGKIATVECDTILLRLEFYDLDANGMCDDDSHAGSL